MLSGLSHAKCSEHPVLTYVVQYIFWIARCVTEAIKCAYIVHACACVVVVRFL